MTVSKNVLVIGTGGVGAITAYGLDFGGKCSLSIVVRRDYAKVSEHGYRIHSCDYGEIEGWKPAHIYSSVKSAALAQTFDYVVITTKNYPDILPVEKLIEPLVTSEKVTIVLIQNGFDLAKDLFVKYPKNIVLSGVSHIGLRNTGGEIFQTQKDHCVISSFENPNLPEKLQMEKAHEFIDLYTNEKNDIRFFPDVKWYRYRKLVYNATLNTVCALTSTDCGRLELSGGLESVAIPAMKEVVAVAKADGVELPLDIVNIISHADDGEYYEPLMRIDVRKENPIELQVILGNLLKVAEELDVETPVLSLLYKLLLVVQFRLKEANGYVSVPKERPIPARIYE